MVHKLSNKAGAFLKISKLENGILKTVVVPGEEGQEGWSLFYRDLKQVLEVNRGGRHMGDKEEKEEGCLKGEKRKAFNEEVNKGVSESKDSRWAVVFVRNTLFVSWSDIRKRVSELLGREIRVYPMYDDRAVVWCSNNEDKQRVLKMSTQFGGKGKVEVYGWRKELHWENMKVRAKDSWVGIDGLPLSLWNIHVFKVLGSLCGGLMKIAGETLEKKFIRFAKLKVRGRKNGFLNSSMEVPFDGGLLRLGIRAIRRSEWGREGYSTAEKIKKQDVGIYEEDRGVLSVEVAEGGEGGEGSRQDFEKSDGNRREFEKWGRRKARDRRVETRHLETRNSFVPLASLESGAEKSEGHRGKEIVSNGSGEKKINGNRPAFSYVQAVTQQLPRHQGRRASWPGEGKKLNKKKEETVRKFAKRTVQRAEESEAEDRGGRKDRKVSLNLKMSDRSKSGEVSGSKRGGKGGNFRRWGQFYYRRKYRKVKSMGDSGEMEFESDTLMGSDGEFPASLAAWTDHEIGDSEDEKVPESVSSGNSFQSIHLEGGESLFGGKNSRDQGGRRDEVKEETVKCKGKKIVENCSSASYDEWKMLSAMAEKCGFALVPMERMGLERGGSSKYQE